MMPTRSTRYGSLALALLALGVFSCRRKADPADLFDLGGLDETSVEGVAVRELAHLAKRGVTVAQWQSVYPTDSVRVNAYVDRLSGHDISHRCGYVTRTTTTSGLLVIRDALFSFRDVHHFVVFELPPQGWMMAEMC